MNRSAVHIPGLILLLLALTGGLAEPAHASKVDPVTAKKELRQMQQRIERLQQQIKSTQTQRSSTEEALRKAEKDISATRTKLREVSAAQTRAQAQVQQLQQDQARLNSARNRQKDAMKTDIGAAYRAGRQEYIKLLLNQEDPDKLSRLMKYYEYFRAARLQRINTFNQTLADISANEQQLGERMAELDQLRTQLDDEQQQLNQARDQRKSVLAQLDSTLATNSSQVQTLKSSQKELEKVLRAVQESLNDLPQNLGRKPFAQLQGKLRWPTQGKLLHRFGAYRENGALRWNGVLIGAGSGSAVRAVHQGRVVFADWMRGFGMLIIIDHGGGYLSLYGHNESVAKGPGDWVAGGETIAYSGNSGGQSRAGLYFEIRHQGKPVNPARWCRG